MKHEEIISTIKSVKGAELHIGMFCGENKFLINVVSDDGKEGYYSYEGLICNDEGKDDTFFVKLGSSDIESTYGLAAKVAELVQESLAALRK